MVKKLQSGGFKAAGYTMVEMLVVIGIIGILASVLLTSFNHVRNTARKNHAQALVSEVATAFTIYLQRERAWPAEWTRQMGQQDMDHEVCRIFQEMRLLDISPYEVNSSGTILETRNKYGVDRFGLLDPWGQLALKKRPGSTTEDDKLPNGTSFRDHRLQFCLDRDLDGYVDGAEGAPKGIKVRASVLVWSRGPDGKDDFTSSARYPQDDNLSWPVGLYR